MFIDKAPYDGLAPLSKLVYYTEHQNIIRRGGVISTIKYVSVYSVGKFINLILISVNFGMPTITYRYFNRFFILQRNVSFDTQYHMILLDPRGINILPFILLPLCGPEEFDLDVR